MSELKLSQNTDSANDTPLPLAQPQKDALHSFAAWVNADEPSAPLETSTETAGAHESHGTHDAHESHGTHDAHESHGTHDAHETATGKKAKPMHKQRVFDPLERLSLAKSVYTFAGIISGLALAFILLLMVAELPLFASADNPALNEVYTRYLEQGVAETGATNIVSGMILDYRAFDTFGESAVLFTAVVTVIFLLKKTDDDGSEENYERWKEEEMR